MSIARKRRKSVGRIPGAAVAVGLLAGLGIVAGCLMRPAAPIGSVATPQVRVRLLAKAESVQLTIDGHPRTIAAGQVTGVQSFASQGGKPIAVNGKRFHGQVRLVPVADGTAFDVVNVVSIDEYLEGVVPSEAFGKWPADALKAQAVASRTYALYQIKSREDRERHFDLHADVRSQAYGGVDAEVDATNDAVERTRGVVLTYGTGDAEKIFCAYFSSTCGGITASGADVYDDETPPLRPRTADACTESPMYRWDDFTIRKDELARRVRVWGQRHQMTIGTLGTIRSVEVLQRNELGRPARFVITDDNARRYTLNAEQFRNACNADRPEKAPEFLSSFFEPIDAGDSVRITNGRGWGHGVGMCQYCTLGWSRRGMGFAQILKTSYPGAALVRAY